MNRLVTVARVHLVGLLVAAFDIGGGPDRIAERAVVSGRIFRGVRETYENNNNSTSLQSEIAELRAAVKEQGESMTRALCVAST